MAFDEEAQSLLAVCRQGVIIRADTIPDELHNTLIVQVPIGVRDAEVDGTAAQVLEIDMAAVDLTRVRFEATQNSLLEAAIAVTVVEFLQSRPASALLCTAPRRGC